MADPVDSNAAAPAAAPAPAAAAPAVTSAAAALVAPAAGDPAAAPAPGAAPAAAPAAPALSMPGKDGTPEQWSAFYAQIGRPETPEGYELPVPEGDDGTFAKSMAPMLHKHGISADQAKGLAGDWNAMVAAQKAEAEASETAAAAARHSQNTTEAAALKNEWGQQHTENMEFAKRAVSQFFPGDKAGAAIDALEGVLGYKGTIQFLHGVGKGLGEHDAAGMGDRSGVGEKTLAQKLYGGTTPG